MGRYFTKRMMFLLLTLIMLLPLLISSSSSGEPPVNSNKNGVSIANEGRFSSSASEGKLADLESEDLNVCKVFHGKTCYSASRTLSAVQNLATYGEAVKDCLDLFEVLESSICQSGTLPICASFCDANNQVIVPCGASESIICGKATKWESNGTAFCSAVGFTVQSAVEEPCYESKPSLEPPFVVEEQPLIKTEHSMLFQPLQIYWVVTVILLRRICWLQIRGRYQQQRRALVQRERVVRNMYGIA